MTAKVFKLHFRTDTPAFERNENAEIIRVLRDTAKRIERGDKFDTFRTIFDKKGESVGVFALKVEDR